ncbi:unnamed protein product [Amoebophrya sp. A25]|nr:unnamed protein product [Amoebophrya sp. A25]|eukprot:GSA25T00000576001.1
MKFYGVCERIWIFSWSNSTALWYRLHPPKLRSSRFIIVKEQVQKLTRTRITMLIILASARARATTTSSIDYEVELLYLSPCGFYGVDSYMIGFWLYIFFSCTISCGR